MFSFCCDGRNRGRMARDCPPARAWEHEGADATRSGPATVDARHGRRLVAQTGSRGRRGVDESGRGRCCRCEPGSTAGDGHAAFWTERRGRFHGSARIRQITSGNAIRAQPVVAAKTIAPTLLRPFSFVTLHAPADITFNVSPVDLGTRTDGSCRPRSTWLR